MLRIVGPLALAAFVLSAARANAQPPAGASREWDEQKRPCTPGLKPQPGGPYAVVSFCEDALGTYVAVVRLEPIGQPSSGRWALDDRYWYEPQWVADATGYRWSSDGLSLFITTSAVYGSGGAFRLDLAARHAIQLLPSDRPVSVNTPGPGFRITEVKSR